ncbi:MAG: histidinol-phosphate transaminase [Victivallales bacterium]|nr:histidinol-phosphate transaminase [Victivallales bacterium]MCF7888978.1 histidinol-phosphate transaminase [Victivallales bacterium]
MSYFRKNIEKMEGYTPGEQPALNSIIKLNTNENPYPPSPGIYDALKKIDPAVLRLYPNPSSDLLRNKIAGKFDVITDNVLVGNGSDDILTIAVRSFLSENEKAACFTPSYSLYPVLAQIQNTEIVKIPLEGKDFSFPAELVDKTSDLYKSINTAKIFFITRPNAPTGTNIKLEYLDKFCTIFKGIVFIDEAYADFSDNNALPLLKKHDNIIISRTFSKSYSLAGIRVGWAMASKYIINGMMKVKDSYNVNTVSQYLASEALDDTEYLKENLAKIIGTRKKLSDKLRNYGFKVLDSRSNFIFASPPDGNAEKLFKYLRSNNIIVRYFPGERTGKYIRITIGTDREIDILLKTITKYIDKYEKV